MDARARDILVPGCASLTRATQVHRDRRRLQNPTHSPRLAQRERGIEGVARIRPKAASGEMGATTDARARDILVPPVRWRRPASPLKGKESARNRGWEPRRKRPAQGRPQWLEAVKAQPARSTTSNPATGSTSAS